MTTIEVYSCYYYVAIQIIILNRNVFLFLGREKDSDAADDMKSNGKMSRKSDRKKKKKRKKEKKRKKKKKKGRRKGE